MDMPTSFAHDDRLLPAIISSFSILGTPHDLAALPPDCEYIDVYAFMQRCLPGSYDPEQTAVDHMAFLHKKRKAVEVATAIENRFAGRQIAAIATFMPELVASDDRTSEVENVRDALHLLVDVVRELHVVRNHPVRVIEIVGGSRMQGIEQKGPADQFIAHRLTGDLAIRRLVDRLRPICEFAAESPSVFFALELEPGPLFVLSDTNSVTRFCELIDTSNDQALSKCIGLNLDIPHWDFLAGIAPEWLEANQSVRRRIIHAHICDHNFAHFSDTVPGLFNAEGRFRSWIDLLKRIRRNQVEPNMPERSGFVSCEMEGCKHAEMLAAAFNFTKNLL